LWKPAASAASFGNGKHGKQDADVIAITKKSICAFMAVRSFAADHHRHLHHPSAAATSVAPGWWGLNAIRSIETPRVRSSAAAESVLKRTQLSKK
jgi:hypothetical protein